MNELGIVARRIARRQAKLRNSGITDSSDDPDHPVWRTTLQSPSKPESLFVTTSKSLARRSIQKLLCVIAEVLDDSAGFSSPVVLVFSATSATSAFQDLEEHLNAEVAEVAEKDHQRNQLEVLSEELS